MPDPCPDFSRETAFAGRGPVAGVDEAGRGPLAGPVVAAAVILDPERIPGRARTIPSSSGRKSAPGSSTSFWRTRLSGSASPRSTRSTPSTSCAPRIWRCSARSPPWPRAPVHCLIDGNLMPRGLDAAGRGGDRRRCAVPFDRRGVDRRQGDARPDHGGFGATASPAMAGSATWAIRCRAHLAALKCHGVTPHHRRSFRPVHNILYQANSVTS